MMNANGVQVTETEEAPSPMDNTEALQAMQNLARSLGIPATRLATAIGAALPNGAVSKLNATCPKCQQRYRVFENYQGDQSVCPACRDQQESVARAKAQRPERLAAERKKLEFENTEAEKQQAETERLITIVRAVVSEMIPQKANGTAPTKRQRRTKAEIEAGEAQPE